MINYYCKNIDKMLSLVSNLSYLRGSEEGNSILRIIIYPLHYPYSIEKKLQGHLHWLPFYYPPINTISKLNAKFNESVRDDNYSLGNRTDTR